MLLIVGHGPSVLCGLGGLIDQQTVVRLKEGLTKKMPAEHFGTRTDYLCARSGAYAKPGVPFWHLPDSSPWHVYYKKFKPKYWKPSHGLSAVFCAIDNMKPERIALIGFDRILYTDDQCTGKWYNPRMFERWQHDQRAENECLYSLGIDIIDFSKVNIGEVSGLRPDPGSCAV